MLNKDGTTMTQEQMAVELNRLQTENDAFKVQQAKDAKDGIKISEKGALSVYGLSRFPVTLYKSQWIRLLAKVDAIRAFIDANDKNPLLKDKPTQDKEVKVA